MSEQLPATPNNAAIAPFAPRSLATRAMLVEQFRTFSNQPSTRRMLPWFAGVGGAGLLALTWAVMSPAPQRVLYASLADEERAAVTTALDQASLDYTIDNATGALTVNEDDLYRARMTVASQGALASPETGMQMLDALPMGASRTLEGDRLRAAQERELQLTIAEIDGVEAVRVHLARAERSVFVRDQVEPSASVMLRLVRGKSLSHDQVLAIANLVAASVPGLSIDKVRLVDQHGRLLTRETHADDDGLGLQARMESKVRGQLAQLLAPMVGEDGFSSEVQIELDMTEATSARESYEKDGAIRRESLSENTVPDAAAIGVPGVLSNTPPAEVQAEQAAPVGTEANGGAGRSGQSQSSRSYELGREVSVTSNGPGGVRRISVAVALDKAALDSATPQDIAKIEALIGAAAGANVARGDVVSVVVRPFRNVALDEGAFWEQGWFASILRNGVALLSVVLILLFAVRPALRHVRDRVNGGADATQQPPVSIPTGRAAIDTTVAPAQEADDLTDQLALARRIAHEQPDDALHALRAMLRMDDADKHAATEPA